LGTMFKILARLLFIVTSHQIVPGTDDKTLNALISDYALFDERVDLWRDGK